MEVEKYENLFEYVTLIHNLLIILYNILNLIIMLLKWGDVTLLWACLFAFKFPCHEGLKASSSTYSKTLRMGLNADAPVGVTDKTRKSIAREYSSFFSPMERSIYAPDVTFVDPLTSFAGIDNYQKNVDLLGGRTFLGSLLFSDASIVLHRFEEPAPNKLLTRWTLQMTVKILPWAPRAKFTGVSIYTIDETKGQIVKQEDYWDSVNLNNGEYSKQSFQAGLADFLGQLKQETSAELAAPELPYELLRRGKRYEVRRYPKTTVVQTRYEQRPEGYDRLGSYVGGSNVLSKKLDFFSPTLMRISDNPESGKRDKVMEWPLNYCMPGSTLSTKLSDFPASTVPQLVLNEKEDFIVGVTRFDLAATEPVVKGYTKQLIGDLKADGLVPTSKSMNELIIAQFDALFSLNKRRNEVWVELDSF